MHSCHFGCALSGCRVLTLSLIHLSPWLAGIFTRTCLYHHPYTTQKGESLSSLLFGIFWEHPVLSASPPVSHHTCPTLSLCKVRAGVRLDSALPWMQWHTQRHTDGAMPWEHLSRKLLFLLWLMTECPLCAHLLPCTIMSAQPKESPLSF